MGSTAVSQDARAELGGSLGRLADVARGIVGRLLVVLVLDVSWSMAESGRIHELRAALERWPRELCRNAQIRRCAEFAAITFGKNGVRLVPLREGQEHPAGVHEAFVPAAELWFPELEADGVSPMTEAVRLAMRLVAERLEQLRAAGEHRYVPAIWLITDGRPTDAHGEDTDDYLALLPSLRQAEVDLKLTLFAVGVAGARADVLAQLAPERHFTSTDISIADALRLVTMSTDSQLSRRGGVRAFIHDVDPEDLQ